MLLNARADEMFRQVKARRESHRDGPGSHQKISSEGGETTRHCVNTRSPARIPNQRLNARTFTVTPSSVVTDLAGDRHAFSASSCTVTQLTPGR
jgi:hypothetical protein